MFISHQLQIWPHVNFSAPHFVWNLYANVLIMIGLSLILICEIYIHIHLWKEYALLQNICWFIQYCSVCPSFNFLALVGTGESKRWIIARWVKLVCQGLFLVVIMLIWSSRDPAAGNFLICSLLLVCQLGVVYKRIIYLCK